MLGMELWVGVILDSRLLKVLSLVRLNKFGSFDHFNRNKGGKERVDGV